MKEQYNILSVISKYETWNTKFRFLFFSTYKMWNVLRISHMGDWYSEQYYQHMLYTWNCDKRNVGLTYEHVRQH
jgi:hypothetical protein